MYAQAASPFKKPGYCHGVTAQFSKSFFSSFYWVSAQLAVCFYFVIIGKNIVNTYCF